MTEEKKPFLVHCRKCSHEWAAVYTPIPVDIFVALAKNSLCPMCGSKDVLCGSKDVYVGPTPPD